MGETKRSGHLHDGKRERDAKCHLRDVRRPLQRWHGTRLPLPDYPEPIPGPVERRITYIPPFDRCDRVADYRTAWGEFKKTGI